MWILTGRGCVQICVSRMKLAVHASKHIRHLLRVENRHDYHHHEVQILTETVLFPRLPQNVLIEPPLLQILPHRMTSPPPQGYELRMLLAETTKVAPLQIRKLRQCERIRQNLFQ